jgi:Protein of unknown function (DUF2786)
MTSENTSALREAQLARIRGLMAKTVDNGCTEAEAAGAAEAVDRLLSLYEIDLDEVTVKEQPIVRLDMKTGAHPIKYAAGRIGGFTDCRVWFDKGLLTYFGFKVDTEIAEYLTLVFRRAIDREISTVTLFNPEYDARSKSQQADFQGSFGDGMAGRLGERLSELKSKRDFTQRGSGTDLVLIKRPLVDQALRDLGITLTSGGSRSKIRDQQAYAAGRQSANNVAISQGIAGRAAQGGMIR